MTAKPTPQPLIERVKEIQAEIDALIDARAAELHKAMPGVPAGVHRLCLTGHEPCQCAAFTALVEKREL